jgi:hypothetical protein
MGGAAALRPLKSRMQGTERAFSRRVPWRKSLVPFAGKNEDPQPLKLRALRLVLFGFYSTAFAAIAFLYHSALSFGYRFCVLKST